MTQEQADEKAKAALLPFGEPRKDDNVYCTWQVSHAIDKPYGFVIELCYTGERRKPWCATFNYMVVAYAAKPTTAVKRAVKATYTVARSDLLQAEAAMRLVNPRPGR